MNAIRWRAVLGTTAMMTVLHMAGCGGEPERVAPEAVSTAAAFTLSAPATATVRPKTEGAVPVSLTRDEGFTTPVTFEVQGLPAGVQAALPAPAATEEASTIMLTAAPDAVFGTHTVVLRAHAEGVVRESPITLVVAGDPGTLDPTFGVNGIVGGPASVEATSAIIDRAGRTVVVGYELSSKRVAVARYLPNGALDGSFANDGTASFDFVPGGSSIGARAAEAPDGSLLVVGIGAEPASHSAPCVAKLDASGALDTSYGSGGVICGATGQSTWATAIEVLPDGSTLIGGTVDMTADADIFVRKLSPDGNLALSFGIDGTARLVRPGQQSGMALHVDAQGRIVVAGLCADLNGSCALRLTPDGQVDPWFGNGGTTFLGDLEAVGATTDFVFAPDGSMYFAAGEGSQAGRIVALEPEKGAHLPGFGVAGVASFPQGTALYGVTWDEGQLHVVGAAGSEDASSSISMRLSSQGQLDAGYGDQGVFVHPGGTGAGRAIALSSGRATILTVASGTFRLSRVWR